MGSAKELGAFEVSAELLQKARHNKKGNVFLNAGRGNPNWINTKARLAFARLIEFGVQESQRTLQNGDMAGSIDPQNLTQRFFDFFNSNQDADVFLVQSLHYLTNKLHLKEEQVIQEWVNGVIGNDYPVPSRSLAFSEVIINHYLQSTLYHGVELAHKTDLFLTEGGTAAMCYIFNSLKENKLLKARDKIVINTPIFPPYLEIPALNDYNLVEIQLKATEATNWELDPKLLDQLRDPELKAFFLVNPSNPGSKALDEQTLSALLQALKYNPNLMIITDDVYGTFVDKFQSVYSIAPYNTLLVYSFSKLYGATGWRIGAIAAHQENVFDQLIQQADEKTKQELIQRYSAVTAQPDKMKFIDRMVADSRSIGLYHTSGLSTPQQIMSSLFALSHLINSDEDAYIQSSKQLIAKRYHALCKSLGLQEDNSSLNAKYYTLVDIYLLAEKKYGLEFAHYLQSNLPENEFLIELASRNGVVLMDGVAFGSSPGKLRISEANLKTEAYQLIGQEILALLAEYYQSFQQR